MTRDEAIQAYARLLLQYGLRWGPKVPREAYEQMTEISKILTLDERLQIANAR